MSQLNGRRGEASVSDNICQEHYFHFIFKSNSQTQVVDGLKNVQTRLKTLVLTLENFNNNEKEQANKKDSKTRTKRESFFRELNQMRNQVTTYVNDITRQIEALRPRNTNDEHYVDKVHSYLLLVGITTDILKKLNELFTDVFDRFSTYIEELWNHMNNGDNAEARRVTQEFNAFFNDKTSSSNKLFNDIQQLMNDIDRAEQNGME
jgi:ElaB/YqjD/DUF883 family membrane-anchored ribosome-binding protein